MIEFLNWNLFKDCLGDGVKPLGAGAVLGVFLVLVLALAFSGLILIVEVFLKWVFQVWLDISTEVF